MNSRCMLLALVLVAHLLMGCAFIVPAEGLPGIYQSLEMPDDGPTGKSLTATLLGTTSALLEVGDSAIMMDAFFSRPSSMQLLFGWLAPDDTRIDRVLKKVRPARKLDAILVSHSHFDHALDSAVVACETGAKMYGSTSVALASVGQLEARKKCSTSLLKSLPKAPFLEGLFYVEAVAVHHSPRGLFQGEVTEKLTPPAYVSSYRMGETYSFLVQADNRCVLFSAGPPVDPKAFQGKRADVVFFSIGNYRGSDTDKLREYWRAVVTETGAGVVIPTHWDDLTKELEPNLSVLGWPIADFDGAMSIVMALANSDGVAVRFLPALTPISIDRIIAQGSRRAPSTSKQGATNKTRKCFAEQQVSP